MAGNFGSVNTQTVVKRHHAAGIDDDGLPSAILPYYAAKSKGEGGLRGRWVSTNSRNGEDERSELIVKYSQELSSTISHQGQDQAVIPYYHHLEGRATMTYEVLGGCELEGGRVVRNRSMHSQSMR